MCSVTTNWKVTNIRFGLEYVFYFTLRKRGFLDFGLAVNQSVTYLRFVISHGQVLVEIKNENLVKDRRKIKLLIEYDIAYKRNRMSIMYVKAP